MKKSNPNLFKIKEINAPLGSVSLYTNTKKDLLYAKASGYINLGLVKKDLSFVQSFNTTHPWTYLVDTSKVKSAHPLNPFYLAQLKNNKSLKTYIVFMPSAFVRLMNQLYKNVNRIDLILKTEKELNKFLNEYYLNEN